jgi:hypothetical protein
MKNTFWLQFAIQEVVALAEAFIAVSTIPPGLKAALQKLIAAAAEVTAAIQSGQ